jgi:hypothetical protein
MEDVTGLTCGVRGGGTDVGHSRAIENAAVSAVRETGVVLVRRQV